MMHASGECSGNCVYCSMATSVALLMSCMCTVFNTTFSDHPLQLVIFLLAFRMMDGWIGGWIVTVTRCIKCFFIPHHSGGCNSLNPDGFGQAQSCTCS